MAWGCEFPDGAVAVRWPGPHPSTAAWGDIRDVEAIHGHGGSTVVTYLDRSRLIDAYALVMPYVLTAQPHLRPVMVSPHPDHMDRLRLVLKDEQGWRWWIALLDGSSDAAIHEEVNGETEHRWVSADGNVWCVYYSPLSGDDPLTTFDEEDR